MTTQQNPSHEEPRRNDAEQQLHVQVLKVLEQHMQQQGNVEVFTNPGDAQDNAVAADGERPFYPDLFTAVEDQLTTVCAVETPGTVSEASVEKWQSYAALPASFLIVVPEQSVDLAQALLQENDITYDKIILYQESAS